MRSYDPKKLNYRDELARRNRLFFILKLTGFIAAFIGVVAGGPTFFSLPKSLK